MPPCHPQAGRRVHLPNHLPSPCPFQRESRTQSSLSSRHGALQAQHRLEARAGRRMANHGGNSSCGTCSRIFTAHNSSSLTLPLMQTLTQRLKPAHRCSTDLFTSSPPCLSTKAVIHMTPMLSLTASEETLCYPPQAPSHPPQTPCQAPQALSPGCLTEPTMSKAVGLLTAVISTGSRWNLTACVSWRAWVRATAWLCPSRSPLHLQPTASCRTSKMSSSST